MVLRTGQAATKLSAPRLPPLPKLRVRKVNAGANSNPCLGLMSSVLACWASSGHVAQACAAMEQQLRICIDAPNQKGQQKSNLNYHLGRFYPQMVGPHKRK